MTKPQAPCLGCTFETGRSVEPNCHMTCEKYLAFDRECKELREKRYKIIEENRIQREIKERRIRLATSGGMYRKKRNNG